MKLEIRLFAGLKCNNRGLDCFGKHEFLMDVPQGTTIKDLHEKLNLVGSFALVNLVNGVSTPVDKVLAEDDRVSFFPPVGGG